MPKNKNYDDEQKQINPTNMAGAHKLIMQGPDAVERAMEEGLGKPTFKPGPDPTYDKTSKRKK